MENHITKLQVSVTQITLQMQLIQLPLKIAMYLHPIESSPMPFPKALHLLIMVLATLASNSHTNAIVHSLAVVQEVRWFLFKAT